MYFPVAGHRFKIKVRVTKQAYHLFGSMHFPGAGHRFKIKARVTKHAIIVLAECISPLQGIGLRSTCLACSLAWVSLCCIYFASAGHRFEIKYCVTRHAYHRFDFPLAGHRFDIQSRVARQPYSRFGCTYFLIAGHRFKITSHDMHRIVLAKSVSLSRGIDLNSNLVSHDKHIIV